MRCDRARELLGAYIDQELSRVERTSVAAHIECCADCREYVGELKRTSKAIAELGRKPAPRALATGIRRRLASAQEQEMSRTRFVLGHIPSSLWRQATALAACCALSAVLTWWVVTSTGQLHAVQQEMVVAHIRSLL